MFLKLKICSEINLVHVFLKKTCTSFGSYIFATETATGRETEIVHLALHFIKSCPIESRNDPIPRSEVEHEAKFSLRIFYSTYVSVA